MKHKKATFGIVGRDYLPHLEEIKRIEKRKTKVDNTLVFCVFKNNNKQAENVIKKEVQT